LADANNGMFYWNIDEPYGLEKINLTVFLFLNMLKYLPGIYFARLAQKRYM